MKLSFRSATLFLPRITELERVLALIIFFIFLFLPLAAEAGLPRAAVSIRLTRVWPRDPRPRNSVMFRGK